MINKIIYTRVITAVTFIFFAFLCYAQPPSANTGNIKKKWLNISYATISPAQKLDIYLPEEGNGPFPVIISIHGGAFMFGDKADEQVNPMLEGLKIGRAHV